MDANPARMAYGVDPTRPERYSLRQARYNAIADDISRLLPEFQQRCKRLQLLDVGVWDGVSMRYVEARDPQQLVDFHGVDRELTHRIYKPLSWKELHQGDLLAGLPGLPSNTFDVVICEQVLEHLPVIDDALMTLSRVTKPGGLLVLGVPIFPFGLHLVRKHVVPWWDRVFPPNKVRGHLQAFSRGSFLAAIEQNCDVTVLQTRGFRIISGGVLRPLENFRFWWNLGCTLGRWMPGLCIEIQAVCRKNGVPVQKPATETAECNALESVAAA